MAMADFSPIQRLPRWRCVRSHLWRITNWKWLGSDRLSLCELYPDPDVFKVTVGKFITERLLGCWWTLTYCFILKMPSFSFLSQSVLSFLLSMILSWFCRNNSLFSFLPLVSRFSLSRGFFYIGARNNQRDKYHLSRELQQWDSRKRCSIVKTWVANHSKWPGQQSLSSGKSQRSDTFRNKLLYHW